MKFFRNVLGTFSTEMAIVGLNFLAGILLARALSLEARGLLALIMLLPVTLAYLSDIGISQAFVYLVGRRKYPAGQVLANSLALGLLIGGFVAGAVWLLHTRVLPGGISFLRSIPVTFVALILGLLPVLLVDTYLLSLLRSQQRFALFNLRRLITPVLLLAGLVVFSLALGWGIQGAFLAFLLSQLLSTILLAVILHRQEPLRLQLERPLVVETLEFGVKSYLQNLAGHLNYRLDIYLLAFFLPASQVAFYTVATGLAEAVFYIPDAVGTVLFPRLAVENDEQAHRLTAEVARHTLLITALACLALLAAGWWLLPLVYGAAYRPAVAPFVVLLPGVLTMAVYKILSRNFTSRNRQQMTILAAAVSLALNLALNLVFIPRWGTVGAALASFLSYTMAMVVLLWAFRRETGTPILNVLFLRRADLARYGQLWQRVHARLTQAARVPAKPAGTIHKGG